MPTRILYVHNSADIYGASRSLLRLLGKLDRQKFEPLVVLPEDGPLNAELKRRGVEVMVDSKLAIITRTASRARLVARFFPSVFRMRRLILEKKIEIVHTNTGVIFSPALASKLAGVRHVWHVRDWFGEFHGLWTAYSAYIRLFSDKIIAVSGPIAEQFSHREKVTVIHNGFALEEFAVDRPVLREAFRKKFQIGADEIVVSCVGRIKLVRKGQEVLLEAAGLLKKRGKRARFVFAGSPSAGNEKHLQTLEAQAKRLGLEADVIFTGELPDPLPVYAASDIFVLPSAQPEPFGGVVMEAMAMGLPVIATAIGGSIEQVAEGVSGFLVPPSDASALADKIELLIDSADLRQRLGHTGPQRIAQHFSIDGMVKKIEAVYGELI